MSMPHVFDCTVMHCACSSVPGIVCTHFVFRPGCPFGNVTGLQTYGGSSAVVAGKPFALAAADAGSVVPTTVSAASAIIDAKSAREDFRNRICDLLLLMGPPRERV